VASRYWVGGGSSTNWNATANTNWAATSGGANNQSVPTTTDNVFFDANSGAANSVISANITVMSVDTTGYTGTITHNASVTLTINTGSATSLLLSSAMTYTPAATSSIISMTNTTGTADITSNGKRLGALTLAGAGGTTRLLDALRVDAFQSSILTITNGVFNANNFNVTAHIVSSNNSNTRTITMGSGTWTIGGNVPNSTNILNIQTLTNLTFNKNTANITVPSNGLAGQRGWASGTLTFNDLTIDTNSGQGVFAFNSGNPTFGAITVGGGIVLAPSSGSTVTGSSLTMSSGTAAVPNGIQCATLGSTATLSITSGSISIPWCVFRDMIFSGGATFAATNSIDLGNNTGISISTPASGLVPTVAEIVAGVWDEPTAGNVTAGTFGAQLKTVLDAVDAKTTNLPSDPADASVIAARFDTLDTSVADLPTNAELATALGTADDAVLAEVALVKAKTDSLTFTVAGQVDANIKSVAGTTVTGVGSEADPWGP
jgi:hypothetical protein